MSPQDTGIQLLGNPGIVFLRQFRDNEARIQLGQESHLMNKKGIKLPEVPMIGEALLVHKSLNDLHVSLGLSKSHARYFTKMYYFHKFFGVGLATRRPNLVLPNRNLKKLELYIFCLYRGLNKLSVF
jgi:hypothetical protein